MKISIFGMGYVGVVTAACLARSGHDITGVDVAPGKVELMNSGRSPVVEDDIDGLVQEGVRDGRLRATTDSADAVARTELAIICVGTPSRADGSLDQAYVHQVIAQIGAAVRGRSEPFYVVVRSTMVPGTMRRLVMPVLEASSGRRLGEGIEVAFHPEFLREGTSVHDFYHPPKIVVGERAPGTSGRVLELYDDRFNCPRIVCPVETAEMVKYCDNLFHAVKVTFANEIGQLCHAMDIGSQEVMEIFCQDTKLNISPRYLRPGFAFGGSCLPKDLKAILSEARERRVSAPMLESVLSSNRSQIDRVVAQILDLGHRDVALYGLAFKPGTDDLRESPLVELAERLIGKGLRLRVYDQRVQLARLVGGNKSYVQERLPHLAGLLVESAEELAGCGVLVLGHPAPEAWLGDWVNSGRAVHDLTGTLRPGSAPNVTTVV